MKVIDADAAERKIKKMKKTSDNVKRRLLNGDELK